MIEAVVEDEAVKGKIFAQLDELIGLDTMKLIAASMYDEYKDPGYAPPPLLLRMVEAGQLGKKSGKGFYSYGAA